MSDGERLAPVTWLFGAPHQQAEPSPSIRQGLEASPPEGSPAGRLDAARAALQAAEVEAQREPDTRQGRDGFARISNVSMFALGRRGMSSRELRDHLVGQAFEPGEADAEVDRLESVGLLDDSALAETLVRTLRERKGLGRAALVAELKRRKLHSDAIEAAMADAGDDELERAIEVAERRARQLRSLEHEVAKRRLGAFLMRKGYGGSVVGIAVERALGPGARAGGGPVFR